MPAITRIGDSTTGVCDLKLPCCPHGRTGNNGTASPDVWVNGIRVHRLTDTGPTNCPHGGVFESTQGSGTVFVNGLPITRLGDTTVCQVCGEQGNHSGASPDVFAGD